MSAFTGGQIHVPVYSVPMTKTSDVPILIVGGGAVGCVLSMELARRGVEYRCIDRMAGPGRESRAIALHARTIELMDLVDTGAEPAAARARPVVQGLRDALPSRRRAHRGPARPRLHHRRFPLQLHPRAQPERDRGASCAITPRQRFGRTIEYNTTFQDLTQDADGITARVTHSDRGDEEELIRCRYLIAADGINSRVRRGLGLSVKGKDYTGSFFQNLDIHLHGFSDWTDHFHYCVGTDHFLMVAPLPGGHFRLLLSDRGEAADPGLTPQQAFMRVLDTPLRRHHHGRRRLAFTMGDVGPAGRHVPRGQRVSRRRLRARPLDDRRAGHELLHAGRVQPGVEARRWS